jgi:ribonuclease VapC
VIVDTSIIVALAAREASSDWIHRAFEAHPQERLRMSWVNIAEAGMVLERATGGTSVELEAALRALGVEALEADFQILGAAIRARSRFPLNFGDCFAYAHASLRREPLMTLDEDFLSSDLQTVVHPKRWPVDERESARKPARRKPPR